MRNWIAVSSLAILCSAVLAAAAWAQPRTYTVYRAQTPPKIDGRLDDDCWRAVPWQTGFTLLGGGEVGEPIQTEFAMVWDDASLYVAMRCTDSAMDRLVAKADDGSKDLLHDDHVEIFLAPEKQRDDYAQFAVNSLNKKIDLSYQAKKETATQAISKGGKWISACRRGKTSWELEMALPLAALKIEPHEGVVFVGNIGRVRWADPPAKPANYTWTPQTDAFDHDTAAFGVFKLAGAPPPAMRTLFARPRALARHGGHPSGRPLHRRGARHRRGRLAAPQRAPVRRRREPGHLRGLARRVRAGPRGESRPTASS